MEQDIAIDLNEDEQSDGDQKMEGRVGDSVQESEEKQSEALDNERQPAALSLNSIHANWLVNKLMDELVDTPKRQVNIIS